MIRIEGASGATIPYCGYIEVDISIPGTKLSTTIPLLIVKSTSFNAKVPLIIGTNVLKQWSHQDEEVPGALSLALHALELQNRHLQQSGGVYGLAYHSGQESLELQPGETVVFDGHIRVTVPVQQTAALVQGIKDQLPPELIVTPAVVKLDDSLRSVPVEISNRGEQPIVIKPGTLVGQLLEVTVTSSSLPSSDDTFLQQFDLSHLETSTQEDLQELLSNWQKIFSTGKTDLGHTNIVKHKIELLNDTPFKDKPRRIPPQFYEEVRQHLQELLDAGAIEPSSSPWASNIVIARKKDGSLRLCVDYRRINHVTKRDSYSLPSIEDMLDRLQSASYFTSLDLAAGYHQVEMYEEHCERTAFMAGPLGFFQYKRMPFGLTNAPATFQRLMEIVLAGINLQWCMVYLDDIIIFSSDATSHLEHLQEVFHRLEKANLKLKPSKCHFLKRRLAYLGHIVSEKGIECDPRLTDSLKTWPVPKDIKTLRQFLGFTSYYRKFIQNYAKIAQPLTKLLKGVPSKGAKKKTGKPPKPPSWAWGEDQDIAFHKLVGILTTPPVLAYPDFKLPFILRTDASKLGLGAVLVQKQDGHIRVIGFASRSLNKGEVNYSTYKLEFLGLKWAITRKFHHYLYGNHFTVTTDHNPLRYITTTAKLDAVGHRWLSELANYHFDVVYIPGKSNVDADMLSRRPPGSEEVLTDEVIKETCSALLEHDGEDGYAVCLPVQLGTDVVLEEEFKPIGVEWSAEQSKDEAILSVVELLEQGCQDRKIQASPTARRLWLEREKLFLKEGILHRKTKQGTVQLVLPSAWIDRVFKLAHEDMGHFGRDKTFRVIQERFYWPGMYEDINRLIQSCHRCLCAKASRIPQRAPLHPIVSTEPLEVVCMDFMGLETSKGGYSSILVITDHFTKFAVAVPTRNQKATTTAQALVQKFILPYGIPRRLHSDQGANFESKVVKEMCKVLNIKKSRTTAYHPEGDGLCERFNSTLLNLLRTLDPGQKVRWADHIAGRVHAYNATIHETTGYSPYHLLFGRKPRLPIDVLLPEQQQPSRSISRFAADLRESLQDAYAKAAANADKSRQKQKWYYDKRVRGAVVEVGDKVLVKRLAHTGKEKIEDKWENDVYIVLRRPNPDIPVYEVQREDRRGRVRVLHRNHLFPMVWPALVKQPEKQPSSTSVKSRQERPPPPEESYISSSEEEVEGFLDLRSREVPRNGQCVEEKVKEDIKEQLDSSFPPPLVDHHSMDDIAGTSPVQDYTEVEVVPHQDSNDSVTDHQDSNDTVQDVSEDHLDQGEDEDSDVDEPQPATPSPQPILRPRRQRNQPKWFGDYMMAQQVTPSEWQKKTNLLLQLFQIFPSHVDFIMQALLYVVTKG